MEAPRTQATEDLQQASHEELLRWVDENMPRIKGHARKYLSYSPYEIEEYIQQAYETAFQAIDDSNRKGIPFEMAFWSSFRITCLKMTYTKGEKIEAYHEEFLECGNEDMTATRVPADFLSGEEEIIQSIDGRPDEIDSIDGLTLDEQKMMVQKILGLMIPKERQAWEFLIAGFSMREIARLMGVSRQRIQNLIKRGIRRARKHLASE